MTSPINRSLILVDLQNEFLSSEGRFPIHNSSMPFLEKLPDLVSAFRASGYPIFWIRAEYGNEHAVSANFTQGEQRDATFLEGTHTGRTPCCKKGTLGADFPPTIQALINKSEISANIIITKAWYSAFKDTSLLTELRNRNITDIFIGGLLTNVCVNATVLDARNLGFEITLLEDCLGWRKRTSHDRALRDMMNHGARISSSSDICEISDNGPISISASRDYLAELYFVNGSIPSWRVMMALYEKVHLLF